MNKKLELHKEVLKEALAILDLQEYISDIYDFDPEYVAEREKECIELYSAKLAGLFQLTFNQVNVFPIQAILEGKCNARSLGTIVINETGKAEAV